MDAIRRYYPKDKETNPEKEFAKDIRLEVIDQLNVHPDWEDDIKFYSALGTNVDFFHGVDAWIEIPSRLGTAIVVTLDASLNPIKAEGGYKAQVIIDKIPDPEHDQYISNIEYYGSIIADKLRGRMDIKYLQNAKTDEAGESEREQVAA